MKWFSKILSVVSRCPMRLAASVMLVLLAPASLRAQCPGCVTFNPGILWSNVSFNSLNEASGLAVSTRNPGVVWSHNDDGNDGRLFAFRTNGTGLARYNMNVSFGGAGDIEDMAVGPGPVAGMQYLYVGDIGAEFGRTTVRIVRIPEPIVPPLGPGGPPLLDFTGVQVFTLRYPGPSSWDAETLMVDPVNADIYIGTKLNGGTIIYRANLNGFASGTTNDLEFVLVSRP